SAATTTSPSARRRPARRSVRRSGATPPTSFWRGPRSTPAATGSAARWRPGSPGPWGSRPWRRCIRRTPPSSPPAPTSLPCPPGRRDLLAVPTGLDGSEMGTILARMAALGLKLVRGEPLGSSAEDGYVPHGIRRLVFKDKVGYERAVDMLLDRVTGRPYASEIQVQQYDRVAPAAPLRDLARATIGIVVSTGIVPRGNPDRLPGARALDAGRYSIAGLPSLDVTRWESAHGGFNTKILNTRSPDYALPLGTLRALEAEGAIAGIYPWVYSTVGNQTAVGPARAIGRRVAEEFRDAGV